MRNKVIGIVLVLFYMFTVSAFAKEGQVSLSGMLAKMKNELNLTDEQITAIRPVMREDIHKRQEYFDGLQSEAVVDKTNVKIAMRRFKEETNAELAKFLTPEQMKRLISKQNIRESLNKDQINYSDSISSDITITPQGGAFQF